MAATDNYEKLANLAQKWLRQLQQLDLLAARLKLDRHGKAYARMLALRAQGKLHGFSSINTCDTRPDKRKVEQVSGSAIEEMARTLNYLEAAAQDQLALAKQKILIRGPGMMLRGCRRQ